MAYSRGKNIPKLPTGFLLGTLGNNSFPTILQRELYYLLTESKAGEKHVGTSYDEKFPKLVLA